MTYSIDNFKAAINKHGGLAQANRFKVVLPNLDNGIDPRDIDIFCTNVGLPGKQIATLDKNIGALNYKIPYGEVFVETSMTFLVPNTYNIKKYFVNWQKLAFNTDTLEPGYRKDYVKQVIIQQLTKISTDPVYELTLINAFPISIGDIAFSNDLNGLVALNVGFQFDRYSEKFYDQGPW